MASLAEIYFRTMAFALQRVMELKCNWLKLPAMRALFGILVSAMACAATLAGEPFYATRFDKTPSAAALTEIGRQLFFDPSLSASGRTACANCHDPGRAFGPGNDADVQLAGPDGTTPGVRAVPSLTYTQGVPPFTEHFFENEGNDSEDQGPAGGRTWDGRAQSAHDQARFPLLSAFEMANSDENAVVNKVRRAPYADRLREAFGEKIFDDPPRAFRGILLALEVYQQDPAAFYPYDSKYDAWLRGKVQLSAQEQRGLKLFNDPAKGNCASCHPSGIRDGAFPAFTDFGFVALGIPRNLKIPANADPAYYDLGLCGPLRTDLTGRKEYCGLFRTPSLRNVARRTVFFHNGIFHSLRDVVKFYAERDTHPEEWYPKTPRGIAQFDDLPAAYRDNINQDPPFGRSPGDPPALDASEIDDILAFLQTLNDGYNPRL